MATTTFQDPEDDGTELFWDDLEEWELNQLTLDGWYEEEIEDEGSEDLYDQYEYMLDHQEDE